MKNKILCSYVFALLVFLPKQVYPSDNLDNIAAIFSSKEDIDKNLLPKKIVQNFLQDFVANKPDSLDQYLAKNYQVVNAGDIYDSNFVRFAEISKNLKVRSYALHESFPDLTLTINEMVTEEDKVVVRYTLNGTQKGTFFGIIPTNKIIVIKISAIYTLKNSKITHVSEMWNELSIMKQLGYVVL